MDEAIGTGFPARPTAGAPGRSLAGTWTRIAASWRRWCLAARLGPAEENPGRALHRGPVLTTTTASDDLGEEAGPCTRR